MGGWALGWLASVLTQLDMEMVRSSTKKNIVLSYRTELEGKYRTVISYCTYIPEKTVPYRNIIPNCTILYALDITEGLNSYMSICRRCQTKKNIK